MKRQGRISFITSGSLKLSAGNIMESDDCLFSEKGCVKSLTMTLFFISWFGHIRIGYCSGVLND